MKNKKFSNRQYSLQGYVSGSLSYLPSVGRKLFFFFFNSFSVHFLLLRKFLSTAAVLTFHEYGETIWWGGCHFPILSRTKQRLSMFRNTLLLVRESGYFLDLRECGGEGGSQVGFCPSPGVFPMVPFHNSQHLGWVLFCWLFSCYLT